MLRRMSSVFIEATLLLLLRLLHQSGHAPVLHKQLALSPLRGGMICLNFTKGA